MGGQENHGAKHRARRRLLDPKKAKPRERGHRKTGQRSRIGRSDGEKDQPYSNGEQRQEVETAGARLKESRSNGEAVLEDRGLSESLDNILHDPHAEMSGLDFLLGALDFQVHLPGDQPLQGPQ